MAVIRTEKELGEALKNNQDTIEIEGNLAKKTIKIKATGKVAWGFLIGAIGIAAAGLLYQAEEPKAQIASKAASAFTAAGATLILGPGTTAAAIAIAVAAGGVGALNKLRKYKIVSSSGDRLILKKS